LFGLSALGAPSAAGVQVFRCFLKTGNIVRLEAVDCPSCALRQVIESGDITWSGPDTPGMRLPLDMDLECRTRKGDSAGVVSFAMSGSDGRGGSCRIGLRCRDGNIIGSIPAVGPTDLAPPIDID